MVVVILVIYVLAVARLTRLINADTILDPVRLWLEGRKIQAEQRRDEAAAHGQAHRAELYDSRAARWGTAVYFMGCPWCVGMWVCLATAIVPVQLLDWAVWTLLPVALAASHLIGVFGFAADTEDIEVEGADADR